MSQKFLITRQAQNRSTSEVWDTSEPFSIGHPLRYVLEKTNEGIIVRDLTQTSAQTLSSFDCEKGKWVSLNNSNLKLKFNSLHTIQAAYRQPSVVKSTKNGEAPQLFVFSGQRRTLSEGRPVHSAYVAYVKSRPAFTIQYDPDGVKVKVLLEKVNLKIHGKDPWVGQPGDIWHLSFDQLSDATLVRGHHWWRLNLVHTPEAISDHFRDPNQASGDSFVSHGWKVILALMIGASFLLKILPHAPTYREVPAQVADEHKAPKIYEVPVQRARAKKVALPQKKEEPAPAPVAAGAPAPPHKKQPKQKQPVTVAPVKNEMKPEPARKAIVLQKPKGISPEEAAAATAKKVAIENGLKIERAKAAAQARSNALQAALGGVDSLVSKEVTQGEVGNAQVSGVFKGKGTQLSATQVTPQFAGSNVQIGKLGGGGTGKGVAGYGSGEHGSVSGQGSSLTSVDSGGSMVEEGLSKEEVGAIIHAHLSEIRYCHESAMLRNPKVAGKLTLRFSIDPSGQVESTETQSSTLGDADMSNCIIKHLKTWKFPKPRGASHVAVSYPFLFKTLSME